MPNRHYFECPKGHISEHTFPSIADFSSTIRCKKAIESGKSTRNCNQKASKIYITDREGQNALRFKPIEFFQDSNGEIINLGCSINDLGKLPFKVQKKMKKYISKLEKKGYKLQSIENFFEYQKFRKSQNEKLTALNIDKALSQEAINHQAIKREFDDLKYGFTMERQDGSKVSIPPLDKFDHPQVAQLARDLMEDRPISQEVLDSLGDSKIANDLREINNRNRDYDAGFHIDSMENDSGKGRRSWI